MGRGMGEERSENRDNLYRFLVDPMVVVMERMGNKTKQNVAAPAEWSTARRTSECTTVLPRIAQRRCGIQHQHRTVVVDRNTHATDQAGLASTAPGSWSSIRCRQGWGETWHHASHWEATDQSRLVHSGEGAAGEVGQRPSAVSEDSGTFSGDWGLGPGGLELLWGSWGATPPTAWVRCRLTD